MQEFVGGEVFWGALGVIVTLAGSVGTALAFAVNALIRHRERPHPDWAITMRGHGYFKDKRGMPDGYHLEGHVSNAGDGDAFRVRLEAESCDARFDAPKTGGRVALVRPGEEVGFRIGVPLGGWEAADVEIVWIDPPTRLQKESRAPMHPRLHMDRPEVTEVVTDPETGVVSRVPVAEFRENS